MKMIKYLIFLILATLLFYECGTKGKTGALEGLSVELHSTFPQAWRNILVTVPKDQILQIQPDYIINDLAVYHGDEVIEYQCNENGVFFMIDELSPDETKQFVLKSGMGSDSSIKNKKKTQAELSVKKGGGFESRKYIGGDFVNIDYLRVPDEHTDHSYYIRYEGPGWESDLVGYRFYLDWRNAIDVFGKKTHDVILHEVGLDGFDSYHEMQPWGVDVLKVGQSLGIGTLAIYHNGNAVRIDKTDSVICQVMENGQLYSAIKTNYYGWKVEQQSFDIESILSIHAGTRLTHHEVTVTGNPDNLCTGIVKDKNARLYTDHGNSDQWGYIATYGVQSLNNDQLGLVVFFSNEDYKGLTEDEFSYVVKLNVEEGQLDYYFGAAWEGEKGGIKNEDEFIDYIKQTARELANPIEVSIKQL